MRTDTRARQAQLEAGLRARVQARLHDAVRAEAHARVQAQLQAGLLAAGQTLQAANQTWQQSRPGALVRQYRGSEFHGRTSRAVRVRFRLPAATDPAPGSRRLALVAAWAGTLGLAGALIAVPVLVDMFRAARSWYLPVMLLVGLVGVGATAGAFASIHRRRAPWIGLGIGTAALLLAIVLTITR
jgi:hypothetical protein